MISMNMVGLQRQAARETKKPDEQHQRRTNRYFGLRNSLLHTITQVGFQSKPKSIKFTATHYYPTWFSLETEIYGNFLLLTSNYSNKFNLNPRKKWGLERLGQLM